MTRSGYAKGANSGHITKERELPPKPSNRKGVSYIILGEETATDACGVDKSFERGSEGCHSECKDKITSIYFHTWKEMQILLGNQTYPSHAIPLFLLSTEMRKARLHGPIAGPRSSRPCPI